jgi:hypothetical protein
MKPTRVFLSIQPVGYKRPAGANPFTYRDPRPSRWRASWWTDRKYEGHTSELYRSKPVATREEAVRLAYQWLDRQRKATASHSAWDLVDTTEQPERNVSSTEKKSAAQLDAEIAETLAKAGR